VSAVHFSEYGVQASVGRLKNAKDLTNALNTLQTIGVEIEGCRYDTTKLPEDSSAASVRRELNERAQTFGVPPPMRIPDAPRANAIAFMQRQALDALREMYRFIPYTEEEGGFFPDNLAQYYGGESSTGKPIQDQLREAMQIIEKNVNRPTTDNRGGFSFSNLSSIMQFLEKAESLLALTS
jgi:hypothetical protein